MLEMLKARKEQLQAEGKNGFTLMEMLIVIAIIAILIAIAIPLFTSQLNNAKHAADEANARSIYAMAMADYMDNNTYDNTYAGGGAKGADVTITSDGVSQVFEVSDIGTITVTTGTGTPTVKVEGDGFDAVTFPGSGTGSSSSSAATPGA